MSAIMWLSRLVVIKNLSTEVSSEAVGSHKHPLMAWRLSVGCLGSISSWKKSPLYCDEMPLFAGEGGGRNSYFVLAFMEA